MLIKIFNFAKNFLLNKKFRVESTKGFQFWINYSIWNRAKFVYTFATINALVRYCLYSFYNGFWTPDLVTLYSVFISFAYATLILFVFGIFKLINFSNLLRRFIDIDRIRENKVRFAKVKELTAKKHNAQRSLKAFSSSAFLNFSTCFLLMNMTFKTDLLIPVTLGCIAYHLWILYHAFVFRKYLQNTPIPDELKHVYPKWVLEPGVYGLNNSTYLVTGSGTGAVEASGGVVRKIINNVSNGYKRSYTYVTTPSNLPVVAFVGGSIVTAIGGSDYIFAEANGRTTITTRVVESATNGTYSPDPDTRSKASALRRKGVSLFDCCEPNSRCLDSDLVDSKYEEVKPYEPLRYRLLEQQNSSLEQQNSSLRGEVEKLNKKIKNNEKILDSKELPSLD